MKSSQQPDKKVHASECWDFFDKVYCISVDERSDRRDEARAQFRRVGLLDKVEFVIVKKHPSNREQGIYESHIKCLKKGIRADADNIMIFEDDILFERFSGDALDQAVGFLAANADWQAFFLGCLVKKSRRTKIRSLLKIKYRSLAHAYVLNRRFAETIAGEPWRGTPFDAVLGGFDGGFYVVYPSFAFQSSSWSDNDEYLFLDKARILFGGLRRIQKMNELYHRNKAFILALHFLLVILILYMITV